jgi:hypothetical protein
MTVSEGLCRYPGTRVTSVPSLSNFVLVHPGQEVGSDVGPALELATSSTKRGQRQVTHQVSAAGLVPTRPRVRAHYVVGVLTPEAH